MEAPPHREGARGWAWLLGLAALLTCVGLAIGINEMVLIGAGFAAVVAYAHVAGRRPLRIEVRRALPVQRVSVGEPAFVELELTNEAKWTTSPLVGTDRLGDRVVPFASGPIGAGASRTVTLPLPTDKRGVFESGPVHVENGDPFRLLTSARSYGGSATLYVRPRVHKIAPLAIGSRLDADGTSSDSSPRGSESFHALREYQPGDDFRLIHWRSSARTGELVVREFVDLWVPEQVILLDNRNGAASPAQFEELVEIAASLAVAAWTQHWPVTVVTADGELVGMGGRAARPDLILDHLAAVGPAAVAQLDLGVQRILAQRSARSAVVITASSNASELLAVWHRLARLERRTVLRLGASPLEGLGGAGIQVASVEDFVERWSAVAA